MTGLIPQISNKLWCKVSTDISDRIEIKPKINTVFRIIGLNEQFILYLPKGVYKVPYSPTHVEFIQSVGEQYQVMRGREYHGCGEEYNVKKGRGEAISSSLSY